MMNKGMLALEIYRLYLKHLSIYDLDKFVKDYISILETLNKTTKETKAEENEASEMEDLQSAIKDIIETLGLPVKDVLVRKNEK